jgi:hypothetical protein
MEVDIGFTGQGSRQVVRPVGRGESAGAIPNVRIGCGHNRMKPIVGFMQIRLLSAATDDIEIPVTEHSFFQGGRP